jgi:phosphoribosylformylglycinamidine synthase
LKTKATQFCSTDAGEISAEDISKLNWLLPTLIKLKIRVNGFFCWSRAAMVTPWSTNAVEITQNMAISGIIRIEEFHMHS